MQLRQLKMSSLLCSISAAATMFTIVTLLSSLPNCSNKALALLAPGGTVLNKAACRCSDKEHSLSLYDFRFISGKKCVTTCYMIVRCKITAAAEVQRLASNDASLVHSLMQCHKVSEYLNSNLLKKAWLGYGA